MFIDDILGAYKTRYFGAGHKNTTYYIQNNSGQRDENNRFFITAEVCQNGSWSKKNEVNMVQHLSTIDGLILAVSGAEKYLEKYHHEIDLENLFLASFEIRAGNEPIEDFKQIPILLKKVVVTLEIQSFTVSILGMTVKIQLKEALDKMKKQEKNVDSPNYMTTHVKNVRQDISDIQLFNGREIICNFKQVTQHARLYRGVNSGVSRTVSLVEWLITFSQMSQVIAYNYDDIDRQYSDTLWMRSIKAELKAPYLYDTDGVIVTGGINKSSLLTINSENWRLFNMSGETADSQVKFLGKMAHKLPSKGGIENV